LLVAEVAGFAKALLTWENACVEEGIL